jgi:hypothetical protein
MDQEFAARRLQDSVQGPIFQTYERDLIEARNLGHSLESSINIRLD